MIDWSSRPARAWLAGALFFAITCCWLLAAGCYTEAEMQVQRDEADMLRRAVQLCEESSKDYLGKLEATVQRCQEQANAEAKP